MFNVDKNIQGVYCMEKTVLDSAAVCIEKEIPDCIVKRGDIWHIDLSDVTMLTSYITGKSRPAVVISDNVINANSGAVIVLPFYTIKLGKKVYSTHMPYYLDRDSVVKCEQILTVDKFRLVRKLGRMSGRALKDLETAFMYSVGMQAHSINNISSVKCVGRITDETRVSTSKHIKVSFRYTSVNGKIEVKHATVAVGSNTHLNGSFEDIDSYFDTLRGFKFFLANFRLPED